MVEISIIMLSYNRDEEIAENIPRLCAEIKEQNIELIVVDNASDDNSQALLQELEKMYDLLNVILLEENTGVAEGRNVGCRAATGDFFLIIDDDTRMNWDDIYILKKTMDENPDCGIVSPEIKNANTGDVHNEQGHEVCEVGNYAGACHLLRREVWERVGEFDPKCTFGGEELDYSIRARAAGYRILHQPQVTVLHNALERDDSESNRRRKLYVFNFVRVHNKHFPILVATKFSIRYLISSLFHCFKLGNVILAISCIIYALYGAALGRKEHNQIPDETVNYYDDHSVRPEYGNMPIMKKILALSR